MSIRYYDAPDVKQLTDIIVRELGFAHINSENVYCFRSRGSRSKRTVARVHSLEKLWQLAIKTQPRYLIEVIAERYDKLSQEDKEKVIIHELLHIPKGFSGGFRPHKGYITQKAIDKLHETYKRSKTPIKTHTCFQ
jgi:predicted metallopeptidase